MAYSDVFFTVPSKLGRRMSMVDPLGFRGVATHLLHRLAPGFTGRVRGRTWFPVLCWAAKVIEEDDTLRARDAEDARTRIRARRASMANLERALRLGAVLENEIEDTSRWRYGNRPQWWENNRRAVLRTKYRDAETPPFFSSRASELANNALGCLRRALERHAFMVPSETRLSGGSANILREDRFRLTERGHELANAYEFDLRTQRVELSPIKDWGLFPDRLGSRTYANDANREAALRKMVRAIPVDRGGAFEFDRFPQSSQVMDRLFQADRDPLIAADTSGPIPAVARAVQRSPDAHPLEAYAASDGDPWSDRLQAANAVTATLMGPAVDGRMPLFETLGRCFVAGMQQAFPDAALDCPRFDDQHAGFVHEAGAEQFTNGRQAFLRAWDRLEKMEQYAADQLPSVERNPSGSALHFHGWVAETQKLSLSSLVELHCSLPRFAAGRVLPLVEPDAGGAFLDAPFPWSDVQVPAADTAAAHDSDVSDAAEAMAPEDVGDESAVGDGRFIITDYWYTAHVARDVILGGPR